MNLQTFTTKLQSLCHDGHSMKDVVIKADNARYSVLSMECVADTVEIKVGEHEKTD